MKTGPTYGVMQKKPDPRCLNNITKGNLLTKDHLWWSQVEKALWESLILAHLPSIGHLHLCVVADDSWGWSRAVSNKRDILQKLICMQIVSSELKYIKHQWVHNLWDRFFVSMTLESVITFMQILSRGQMQSLNSKYLM